MMVSIDVAHTTSPMPAQRSADAHIGQGSPAVEEGRGRRRKRSVSFLLRAGSILIELRNVRKDALVSVEERALSAREAGEARARERVGRTHGELRPRLEDLLRREALLGEHLGAACQAADLAVERRVCETKRRREPSPSSKLEVEELRTHCR